MAAIRTYVDLEEEINDNKFMFFPGGEPHCDLASPPQGEVFVTARVHDWETFGYLCVYLKTLAGLDSVDYIHLNLPYFPGARQDRTEHKPVPLTVHLYASLIKAAAGNKLRGIHTFDIHSNAALDLIQSVNPSSYSLPITRLDSNFKKIYEFIDIVVAPDHGAVNRATAFRNEFCPGKPILVAEKVRDYDTGRITHYTIPEVLVDNIIKPGNQILVVDDICDGGATFEILAESIRDQVADVDLHLFVSHGIFSKGVEGLLNFYSSITTTDSLVNHYDAVNVIPIYDPVFNPDLMEVG